MSTTSFEPTRFTNILNARKLFDGNWLKFNSVGIQIHSPMKNGRQEVEDFIWRGFRKHYGANIQSFMPSLISIGSKKTIRCAAGIRGALRHPLFLEKYIDNPIEHCFRSQKINRGEIAEIGNLYGTSKFYTFPLYLVIALVSAKLGYKKLVFCATPKIKTILQKLEMDIQIIGKADPKRIGTQINSWGSYYKTLPELVAVDVEQAIKLINQSSTFSKICSLLNKSVVRISDEMEK